MFVRSSLITVAVAVGLLVSSVGSGSAAPVAPAAPPTAAIAQSAPPAGVATQAPAFLGPRGYRSLLLRMTPKQAARTGLFDSAPAISRSRCMVWSAKSTQPIQSAVISKKYGVVVIYARNGSRAQTPEGMHLGMTAARVHQLYPSFDPATAHQGSGVGIAVPGHPGFAYVLHFDYWDQVWIMGLSSVQDCFS